MKNSCHLSRRWPRSVGTLALRFSRTPRLLRCGLASPGGGEPLPSGMARIHGASRRRPSPARRRQGRWTCVCGVGQFEQADSIQSGEPVRARPPLAVSSSCAAGSIRESFRARRRRFVPHRISALRPPLQSRPRRSARHFSIQCAPRGLR